jgi:hypothetical protein
MMAVRVRRAWPGAGLAVAALAIQAIYARGWDNGPVSDDWYFLFEASKLTTPAQLLPLFSYASPTHVRPTQWLLLYALYPVFGAAPIGYHVVSQALDLGNAFLVGLLAWQLFQLAAPEPRVSPVLSSAIVALLFLGQWRHHDAVLWPAAVNEPLAAALRLVTLNLVAWWLRVGRGFTGIATAATFGCGLAILSKESAALLPIELGLLVLLARLGGTGRVGTARSVLLLLAGPCLLLVLWAYVFVSTSVILPDGLLRGVSQTLQATPLEWALRLLQFVNASYVGLDRLSGSPALLGVQFVLGLALGACAVARRRYLWVFALAWTVVALTPYVAVSSGPDVGRVPVLALGVRGDRYLYYGAAGASLLLVTTGLWLLDELVRVGVWEGAVTRVGVPLAVASLVAANAALLTRAEAEWDTAGRLARHIVTEVRQTWPAPQGGALCLGGVPHTYGGKPVLRNGLAESLFLAYGRDDFAVERLEHLPPVEARMRCTVALMYAGSERGLMPAW